MPRMGGVADSFLDGFGSLAGLFEPVIRPGSMDNLIQEDGLPALAGELKARIEIKSADWSTHLRGFVRHALGGTLVIATVLGLLNRLGWLPHFVEAALISIVTLLVVEGRDLIERFRQAKPPNRKAAHGA